MTGDAPGPAPTSLRGRLWDGLARANSAVDVASLDRTDADAVLMYHSVGSGAGNTAGRTLSVEAFRAQLRVLAERFEVVDLPAVLEPSDRRRVAVTFDDGFETVYEHALPVLREFDVPATCFLIADRIGGETEAGVPYMSERQVRALIDTDRVTIGNHTRTHPWLSGIDDEARLREEVVGARTALEQRFGVEVDRFCYPYGDVSPAALRLVRESHAVATGTAGLVGATPDPHLLPRIDGGQPLYAVEWELTGLAERLRRLAGG